MQNNKIIGRLMVVFLSFGLCWGGMIWQAGSAQAARYHSLHQEPETISYEDSSGVWHRETRTGFPLRHDLTDRKVLCGTESDSCTVDLKTMSTEVDNYSTGTKFFQRFRIYVPPGTTMVNLFLYLPKSAKIVSVSRFGSAPGSLGYSSYLDVPQDDMGGASLDELRSGDYITKNHGGTTILVDWKGSPVTEGGWIYTDLVVFDSSEPLYYNHIFTVSVPEYLDWYEGMTEADWSEFGSSSVVDGGSSGGSTGGSSGGSTGGSTGGSSGGDSYSGDGGGSGGTTTPEFGGIFDLIGDGDTDTDGDGTSDSSDDCPDDPDKTAPETCGCGEPDTDSDGDGIADCVDDVDDGSGTAGGTEEIGLELAAKDSLATVVSKSIGEYEAIKLKPLRLVSLTLPEGGIQCYAAYVKDGKIYVAEETLSGEYEFERFFSGDPLKSYAAGALSDTEWETDVFASLGAMDCEVLKRRDVTFLYLVLSEVSGKYQGVLFNFSE